MVMKLFKVRSSFSDERNNWTHIQAFVLATDPAVALTTFIANEGGVGTDYSVSSVDEKIFVQPQVQPQKGAN